MGGVWRTAKRTKRTSYGRNRGPVDREGCGLPQNGRNGPPTVETGVLLIGRGVAYRKADKTDLLRSKQGPVDREGGGVPQSGRNGLVLERYGRNRGRGVAYRKTGLHGILFISTVDLLQPPRDTADLLQPPRAPVHLASTTRYSTSYCSTTPPPSTVHPALHRLLFIQPSTVYCSSSPPHHGVLFNHPSTATPPPSTVHPALHTTGSCSSRGNATAHCSSTPPATLTVHPRGSIDRLQLAVVAKESLDRVQITAINRSLGFS